MLQWTEFHLFKILIDRVFSNSVLKEKCVQEGWMYFKKEILSIQKKPGLLCCNTTWWEKRSTWFSRELGLEPREKIKGVLPWKEWRQLRRTARILWGYEGRKLKGPKINWNLIWPLHSSKTRKVSLNTLTAKAGLRRVSTLCWMKNVAQCQQIKTRLRCLLCLSLWCQNQLSTGYPVPRAGSWDGELSKAPIIHEEMSHDLLCQLDAHKSVVPAGMHMRVMKELMKELASPLSAIYKESWLNGQVPARHFRINI